MQPLDRTAEARKLADFLSQWMGGNPSWAYTTDGAAWSLRKRTAGEIADEWLNRTELAEVRFADFMGEPDGQIITTAVWQALPYPANAEFKLLVDAVRIAAEAKKKNETFRAGLATVGVLCICIGLLASFGRLIPRPTA